MLSIDLSTLAERLEKATGPDREIDCLIFVATAESPFESYYPDCVLAVLGGFRARVEINEIPPYTASIDAALALVEAMLPPYGWSWRVQHTLGSERASIWREGLRSEWSISLTAPTAPLAILRALVAALAAQEGQR